MSWLWIDCPNRFTVRVELDENERVKTLPAILFKRFRHCIGVHWSYFQTELNKTHKAFITMFEESV